MKKVIIACFLILAVSITANAQNKKKTTGDVSKEVVKLTPAEAGKKDGVAISQFLGLDENLTIAFCNLFEMKHEKMQSPNETNESKKEFSRIVALKIEATIDSNQLEKLKAKHPSVGDVRGLGVFWAIELVRDRETREPLVPFNASGPAAQPAAGFSFCQLSRRRWRAVITRMGSGPRRRIPGRSAPPGGSCSDRPRRRGPGRQACRTRHRASGAAGPPP